MKKNMGIADRAARLIAALIIVILYTTNIITGTAGSVLLVVAILFTITSFISFCPLYTILGINTCKSKSS